MGPTLKGVVLLFLAPYANQLHALKTMVVTTTTITNPYMRPHHNNTQHMILALHAAFYGIKHAIHILRVSHIKNFHVVFFFVYYKQGGRLKNGDARCCVCPQTLVKFVGQCMKMGFPCGSRTKNSAYYCFHYKRY